MKVEASIVLNDVSSVPNSDFVSHLNVNARLDVVSNVFHKMYALYTNLKPIPRYMWHTYIAYVDEGDLCARACVRLGKEESVRIDSGFLD